MARDLTPFVAAIKRIPLFKGLVPEQAMVVLKACVNLSLDARTTLCTYGEPSDKMFVLLSGKLAIISREGAQVARIEPVSPVGEMGIFTGEPRSATVKTLEPSTMFVLSKSLLNHLLRSHPDVELVISRNLISTLSERLRNANQEISHLGSLLADQQAGSEALEEDSASP